MAKTAIVKQSAHVIANDDVGSKARDCGLCEGRDYQTWWNIDGYDIGRCKVCGLVQVLQDVNNELVESLYGEGYYNGENQYVYQKYMANPQAKVEDFGRRLDEFFLHNGINQDGRCLEIGCAFGLCLRAAQHRGWTVSGIELSTYAAKGAREQYGLDVSSDPDALAKTPSASQDLVLMWDVIEHLKDPLQVLREIKRILVPGGVLGFATGDIGSLGARFYGKRWFLIGPPHHLFYFDRHTAKAMLEKAGFLVRSIVNGEGHPLENGGKPRFLNWIAKNDRWIGWRFNSGPIITVSAVKPG